MKGGVYMLEEEKEARLEEMTVFLQRRNLLKVREMLLQNLTTYSEDKEFLTDCYHLVLGDPLIFQKHNGEILDYTVTHWEEERYPTLLADLKKNFSRKRYHLAMNVACYFEEVKQQQAEVEEQEELEVELKEKKKRKPKKPKRILPREQKYLLTGITTTSLLLIGMVVQLILNQE